LEWQVGTIEALRFSPNATEARATSDDHVWVGWVWDTGEARVRNPRNAVERDGTYDRLAVGGPVEAVAGWDQRTNRPTLLFGRHRPEGTEFLAAEDPGPLRISSLAVSADGKVAAAGVKGGGAGRWDEQPVVRVWDAGTRKPIAVLRGHTDWPLAISFDTEGREPVTAGKDGLLLRWRLP
jgi:WD40 repeat protein